MGTDVGPICKFVTQWKVYHQQRGFCDLKHTQQDKRLKVLSAETNTIKFTSSSATKHKPQLDCRSKKCKTKTQGKKNKSKKIRNKKKKDEINERK